MVLTVLNIRITVFWVVIPCNLVDGYQNLEEYITHPQNHTLSYPRRL